MSNTDGTKCHHLAAAHVGSKGGEKICLGCPETICLLELQETHDAIQKRNAEINKLLLEGVPVQQIALKLGISRETVYQRSHKLK